MCKPHGFLKRKMSYEVHSKLGKSMYVVMLPPRRAFRFDSNVIRPKVKQPSVEWQRAWSSPASNARRCGTLVSNRLNLTGRKHRNYKSRRKRTLTVNCACLGYVITKDIDR